MPRVVTPGIAKSSGIKAALDPTRHFSPATTGRSVGGDRPSIKLRLFVPTISVTKCYSGCAWFLRLSPPSQVFLPLFAHTPGIQQHNSKIPGTVYPFTMTTTLSTSQRPKNRHHFDSASSQRRRNNKTSKSSDSNSKSCSGKSRLVFVDLLFSSRRWLSAVCGFSKRRKARDLYSCGSIGPCAPLTGPPRVLDPVLMAVEFDMCGVGMVDW
ncbi:hypothetical protein IWX49DRAFT_171380 [Phyllosticta citricarpa]|uniref:Uncharacterized protein n=2 Tax=Phyllosticta TaxID=121621 RepID=A0ABR1M2R1_9PEZI